MEVRLLGRGGLSHSLNPRSCPSLPKRSIAHPSLRIHPRCHSQSPGDEGSLREQVKRLDQLFYGSTNLTSSSGDEDTTAPSPSSLQGPLPGLINDLPLWRVQWAVLPSYQEVLHVHVPHYVDLFNRLFSGPRPWRFGHLYLPGGSASLGSEDFALKSGSNAPLVGTLMEVVQAVRFPDGRLLILAAGLGRFKVVNALQTVPHSRADVMVLPDTEELTAAEDAAMKALDSLSGGELAVMRAMRASEAAAQHAAVTAAKIWWDYELVHCRVHDRLAVIDSGDDETAAMQFGRRLVNIGSNEVVELPWAEQSGFGSQLHPPVPFDEASALKEADSAASAQAQAAAEELIKELEQCSDSSWQTVEAFIRGRFNGFNSLKERGISNIASGGGTAATEGTAGLEEESSSTNNSTGGANLDTTAGSISSSSSGSGDDLLAYCLLLESQVWEEIDAVRALAEKIAGRATPLAEGLVCLRPTAPPRDSYEMAPGAAGHYEEESLGWSGEGAHPCYPPLRRVQRLSFALASSLGDVSASEGRQAWLEVNSVADRLRLGLAALRRHRGVLAAVVAVRNLSPAPEEDDKNS